MDNKFRVFATCDIGEAIDVLRRRGYEVEVYPHPEAPPKAVIIEKVKAGVDVLSLAKQYGDRLSFMGNIDIRVLEQGDKAAIEAEIAGKMDTLKSLGAAYFWHTDHSVSPNVSFVSSSGL